MIIGSVHGCYFCEATQLVESIVISICNVCHVTKYIENFGDILVFPFLPSLLSGRAQGRARTKMVGPWPYLVYSWRHHW